MVGAIMVYLCLCQNIVSLVHYRGPLPLECGQDVARIRWL